MIDTSNWSDDMKLMHLNYIAECTEIHSNEIAIQLFRKGLDNAPDVDKFYSGLGHGIGRFKG